VNSAAITLCVASQRLFIVINVYFVIESVRELLDTPWHMLLICILYILYAKLLYDESFFDSNSHKIRPIQKKRNTAK